MVPRCTGTDEGRLSGIVGNVFRPTPPPVLSGVDGGFSVVFSGYFIQGRIHSGGLFINRPRSVLRHLVDKS